MGLVPWSEENQRASSISAVCVHSKRTTVSVCPQIVLGRGHSCLMGASLGHLARCPKYLIQHVSECSRKMHVLSLCLRTPSPCYSDSGVPFTFASSHSRHGQQEDYRCFRACVEALEVRDEGLNLADEKRIWVGKMAAYKVDGLREWGTRVSGVRFPLTPGNFPFSPRCSQGLASCFLCHCHQAVLQSFPALWPTDNGDGLTAF